MMRIVPAGARARADAARSSGHVIPEPWLDILDRAVMHRGPDGAGRFRDRSVRPDGTLVDVALVHRRLAILDRAGGHQPMVGGPSPEGHSSFTGPDAGRQGPGGAPPCPVCGPGRRAVVFNGCIYNHRELRAELQAAGHRFATDHSDTEVLLHGWAHWRRGLWRRLEGMFAVGMWDAAAGGAVLARDQFGEKPLYLWTVDRDGVRWHVWASVPPELTALRPALGGGAAEAPRPGAASLLEWVRFGFAPAAPTMVGTAVAPGQAITYLPGTPGHDPAPCDDLGAPEPPGSALFGVLSPDGPLAHRRTAPLDAGAVEVALRGAVRLRLEADVPVGCFLSGGVDSALVAFLAGEAAGGPSTFTVRMPDPELDESEAAGEAARAIGSRHHTLDCGASPAEDLVRLIGQMRVPFGDSSLLPSYWVSRAAHGAVGVALGGDGGDELFGGYDRYRAAGLAALRAPGARFVAGLLERGARPGSRRARAARLLHAGAGDGYPDLVSVFPGHELARLFPAARPAPPTGARPASADEAIAWDVRWYLPHDLLRKTDSASMACPIEVRSPFLDSNLAGLALRARLESLMPGGERKGLLRAVARRHLPAALADRPKRGFAIPVGRWLREDFGGLGTLLRDRLASTEPFGPPALGIDPDRRRVQALVREHMGGVRDHAQRLYLLLVLSLWAERMGRVLAGKAE